MQADQLAVAAAGYERAANKIAERTVTGIYETPGLIVRQITDYCRVGLAKGLHLSPSVVTSNPALMKSIVERGLKNRQRPICRRPPCPNGVGVVSSVLSVAPGPFSIFSLHWL